MTNGSEYDIIPSVIQRQQVSVKASSFPAEEMSIVFVDLLSSGQVWSVRRKFFYIYFTWEVKITMPSKKILEQKQQAVAELTDLIKASVAGVLVNYQGIKVEDDTKMRKALREAGVKYMVVKNSLTGRACENAGYGALKENLNGMTAIAISEKDPVIAAKVLKEYADKVESFQILSGYVDGELLDAAGVNALAEVPSKEILIAKFLGSIRSPLYGFAYAIQAVIDKNNEGGEAAPAEEAQA